MNAVRNQTISDRCTDCALQPRKDAENGCRVDESQFDGDGFRDACAEGHPFWCHQQPGADNTKRYERQVCRAWLAIMERRWYRAALDEAS